MNTAVRGLFQFFATFDLNSILTFCTLAEVTKSTKLSPLFHQLSSSVDPPTVYCDKSNLVRGLERFLPTGHSGVYQRY